MSGSASGETCVGCGKKQGIGQEKFALEHGFDRTHLSGIERGVRNPAILVVERLAIALDVPVEELVKEHSDDAQANSRSVR